MCRPFSCTKAASLLAVTVGLVLVLGGCPDLGGLLSPQAGKTVTGVAPTLTFVQPSSRVVASAGTAIQLQWQDNDSDSNASIRLFYDHNGTYNSGDEVTISPVTTEDPDGAADELVWDTTGLPAGVYRVGAVIDDGVNPPVPVYSPYEVVLQGAANPGAAEPLKLLEPATTLVRKPGETVVIRWVDEDAGHSAQIYLYYDENLTSNDGNEHLIGVVGEDLDGANDERSWTIPTSLTEEKTYHLLGRLVNGQDDDYNTYALGSVKVVPVQQADYTRDLAQIGTSFSGTTFDGYQRHGRLGEVLLGGQDINGDGYADFVMVAPQSISQVLLNGDPYNPAAIEDLAKVGEAYVVFSNGPRRWPEQHSLSVHDVGSYDLHGVTIVGPRFTQSSSGIQSVTFLENQRALPDLVFGIPRVNGIVRDDRDLDPVDSDSLHQGTAGTAQPYNYRPPGWPTNSNSNDVNEVVPPGLMSSGMIVYVSSSSLNSVTPLGPSIILTDEITGRFGALNHPKVFKATGMRIYPTGYTDDSDWGQDLGTFIPLGNLRRVLAVSQPGASGSAGSVRFFYHETMANWLTPLGSMGFRKAPVAYIFPTADNDGAPDPDRINRYPDQWLHHDTTADLTDATQGRLGAPVGLGSFDGDTTDDLALSAPHAAPSGLTDAGIAYILYGEDGFPPTTVGRIGGSNRVGFELRGTQAGALFGHRMAGPGDVNGDGRKDWVITAPMYANPSGFAHAGAIAIVYGKQIYGTANFTDVGTDKLPGAIIYGANTDDQFGLYMAAAGDVDQDGYPDILVGAPGVDGPNRPNCGAVYLIYGGPHLRGTFDIHNIGTPELPGRVYLGPDPDAGIAPTAGAGDVDGDEKADFLIGYPAANARDMEQSGRVYLIYGGPRQAP